jgi:hypothetical protein
VEMDKGGFVSFQPSVLNTSDIFSFSIFFKGRIENEDFFKKKRPEAARSPGVYTCF